MKKSKIENVNFSKHPIVINANDVQQLMAPLSVHGLCCFAYQKVYHDRSVAMLTSLPGFSEDFRRYQFYRNAFFGRAEDYSEGWFPLSHANCQDALALGKERYQMGTGFVKFKKYDDSVESFYFGFSTSEIDALQFFVKKSHLLDMFNHYFMRSATEVLAAANNHRLIYPDNIIDTSFFENDEETAQGNFYNISLREKECLSYLKEGLSAKQIANSMNVSYRTIEKHFENIRYKTACHTQKELILLAQGVV